MDVSEAIRLKRAVRKFQEEPLPDDVIRAILNAGRRSQSSKNEQGWQFIAIREKGTLKALSQTGAYAGHLAGAALGVAILSPNPEGKFQDLFDVGQAAAYMQLAAWDFGIPLGMAFADRHIVWLSSRRRQVIRSPQKRWTEIARTIGTLGEMVRRFTNFEVYKRIHFFS
jgi:nitroreductase